MDVTAGEVTAIFDLFGIGGLRSTASYPIILRNPVDVEVEMDYDIEVKNLDYVRVQEV